MSIVAEQYEFVIGVDPHATTHTVSVITAATGAVIDQAILDDAVGPGSGTDLDHPSRE